MSKKKMDPTIREQILQVRDTGLTNMFDCNGVQRVANDLDLFELVIYLEDRENKKEYSHFIMYGDDE